ncbi:MAG: sigma-54-dependent transcriptional regulator [Desulfovibrionales bacterium]
MTSILLIDDDRLFSDMLVQAIQATGNGHAVTPAYSIKEAFALVKEEEYDCVLLDVRLPDGNGLDMLPHIRATKNKPEVIIITGEGDPDGAEIAIKNGAWDYIEKPSSLAKMLLPLTRALEYRKERVKQKKPISINRDKIIGKSFPLEGCIELLSDAVRDESNVLITGATGTGKEVFAQTLHLNSSRASKNFVVVDCASLPETLVESALFGHKKGAFTGADRDQEGLILQADQGSLFLDEVGEMPLTIQKSFLRVLQEKKFRPLGSTREKKSDFRVIAATNRNLEEMVQKGTFREDLLFRLRSHFIELPLLKERDGDVQELALHFIQSTCRRLQIPVKGYAPEFLEALEGYPWPGNIRELKNTIEKAVNAARFESILYPTHLPTELRIWLAKNSLGSRRSTGGRPQALGDWKAYKEQALSAIEKDFFQKLHLQTDGNVRKMAEISGLTRARIYGLIKKHGLG